jgi:hypothetical protein
MQQAYYRQGKAIGNQFDGTDDLVSMLRHGLETVPPCVP